jgi:hypothetical protein
LRWDCTVFFFLSKIDTELNLLKISLSSESALYGNGTVIHQNYRICLELQDTSSCMTEWSRTADKNMLILSLFICDCEWGVDWWMVLLATYTHHSELQVITAVSLISTLYKSPQHPLSLFPACYVFISYFLATASNSGDSSASRAQVSSSQLPVQNSILNWLAPRLAAISHQSPSLLFTGWLSTY